MLTFIRPLRRRLVGSGYRFTSTISEAKNNADEAETVEPLQLDSNPYEKEKRKCVLCREGVELDYKNGRLLQQFVSTFSGRVYEQHVTGLCDKQYQALLETVKLSRRSGYMPVFTKDPKYLRDPKLFDPMRPIKPHSYA